MTVYGGGPPVPATVATSAAPPEASGIAAAPGGVRVDQREASKRRWPSTGAAAAKAEVKKGAGARQPIPAPRQRIPATISRIPVTGLRIPVTGSRIPATICASR